MKNKKKIDTLPRRFNSYEAAADFWDKHDTTDYLKFSRPVKVKAELRRRHVEIEIEPTRRRFPVLLKEGVYQRAAQAAAVRGG